MLGASHAATLNQVHGRDVIAIRRRERPPTARPDADVFVRLSDVDPSGHSINICDGYLRKSAADPAVADDVWKLTIRLNAAGHCFRRDHRLRIVIASGAHPRYARNTGTSEPFGTATRLVPMDMEIFHDPMRPSAIHLPVYEL